MFNAHLPLRTLGLEDVTIIRRERRFILLHPFVPTLPCLSELSTLTFTHFPEEFVSVCLCVCGKGVCLRVFAAFYAQSLQGPALQFRVAVTAHSLGNVYPATRYCGYTLNAIVLSCCCREREISSLLPVCMSTMDGLSPGFPSQLGGKLIT